MASAGQLTGTLTRNLAPYFDDQKGAHISKNWLCFVGRGGGVTQFVNETNDVKYEVMRGKRGIAKLVKRSDAIGQLMGRNHAEVGMGEYTQISRTFPLSVMGFSIPASKLREKIIGEPTDNSGYTKKQRALFWAGKGQQKLMADQGNLANLLAGQGILTGYQDAILGTAKTSERYDFYRNSDHIVTLANPWSTPAAGTPLADLDTGFNAIVANRGPRPEFALMGTDALRSMLLTDEVTGVLESRGLTHLVQFEKEGQSCPAKYQFLVDAGWECAGYIKTLRGRGFWIFTTEELMADYAGGSDAPAMPLGQVVLGNTNSRFDAQFGDGETLEETPSDVANYVEWFGITPGATPSGEPKITNGYVRPEMFMLDAIRDPYKTGYLMRSQFAPLYIPVDTDSWYVITNASV